MSPTSQDEIDRKQSETREKRLTFETRFKIKLLKKRCQC